LLIGVRLLPVGKRVPRLGSRWALPFTAGLLVLLVPTLFTVFPGWGLHWSVPAKLLALIVWLAAAAVAVVSAIRQGQQVDDLVTQRQDQSRTEAMERLIRLALTPPGSGLPNGHHVQMFLPSADQARLIAEFDPDHVGPAEGWRIDQDPPQAVTGAAFKTNSYIFARGAAVSDATYGLTPEQQARYRELTGVAATPIQNARGRPVGVLTLFTSEPDPKVSEPDVIIRLVALSEIVGRLLIDVGGKASD
jgi:hypothetical protein